MPRVQVIVYENGVKADQSQYSGQELESLIEQIESVWTKYNAVVVLGDDESLLVWSSDAVPESLLNKEILISPRKFGMRKWPEDMRVMFTPLV